MSIAPQEMFNRLMSVAKAEFQPLGFKMSGSTARISREGNTGIINFQRSVYNSQAIVRFTINLGIWSRFLQQFSPHPEPKQLTETYCHWRERIGGFMPSGRDHWWQISASTESEVLEADIRSLLRSLAVPTIMARLSDEGLWQWCRSGRKMGSWYELALARKFSPGSEYDRLVAKARGEVAEQAKPRFLEVLSLIEARLP